MKRAAFIFISLWLALAPGLAGTISIPFPGPGGVAGVATPATVTFVSSGSGTASAINFTFTAQNIGTAAANRCVVVVAGWRMSGGGATNLTGVTIGGVSATQTALGANNGTSAVGIYSLVVTTGTTANIVVSFNGVLVAATGGIGVYNVINNTTSCPGSAGGTTITNGGTMNVNIVAGGVGIAVGSDNAGSSCTFTGLTKDFTVAPSQVICGGSAAFASAQTPLAVTITDNGGGNGNYITAAWGP